MKIPNGHQAVMPYLMLVDAAKFIDFCQKVFNATLLSSRKRDDGVTIMHAEVNIDGSTIMFSEASKEWKPATANMFVYVDNADKTYQLAVDAGAVTIMELSDQDYGRTCGVTDPFGNVWWITSVK